MNLKVGDFVKVLKDGNFFKIVQIKNITMTVSKQATDYIIGQRLQAVLIKNA